MGGMNSIARWFRARPQLAAPDFSHPTAAGQAVIATLLFRALMREYAAFRQTRAGEALPPLSDHNESESPRRRCGSDPNSAEWRRGHRRTGGARRTTRIKASPSTMPIRT